MPPRVLTEAYVAALKPRPTRYEEVDTKAAGLRIVVQPTGAKGWQFRYRADGRRLRIGPYPAITLADARIKAMTAAVAVAAGEDPAAEKRAQKAAAKIAAPTVPDRVEEVADLFIERHARPKTRDWQETQRMLQKDVVPVWRGRRLGEITRADVHELLDGIIDRGAPVGANRVFAQIRKMSRWALQRGLIDRDPTAGLSAPSPETSRDRVLSDTEIAVVWRAANRLGFPYGPLIKALLLTGQRRDEVGGMLWSEIDLDEKVWRLPAERTKNGRAHNVPLSGTMLSLLSSVPRFDGGEFVFSSGRTAPSCYSRAKRQIDALIVEALRGETIPHWVFHDCRRSAASGMGRLGVDVVVIEKALNHISATFAGVTGIYQRQKYENEVRAALDRWGAHIAGLTGQGAADDSVVVNMRGR